MASNKNSALLVVDMQNDFVDPHGSLYVHGAEKLVAAVNAEIARAVRAGTLVVFTQDWHPRNTPHFQKWPVHCVHDTWGAQFYASLTIPPGSQVVRKGTAGQNGYSGFSFRDPVSGEEGATELERVLRERGVQHVRVVGVATDYCVKETALDAAKKGFHTTVVLEGIRPVDLREGNGDRALEHMRRIGVHVVPQAQHRFEEHTGEVRIGMFAPSLESLFAEAGRALAEVMLGEIPELSESATEHRIDVHAQDRAALLVNWMNELVFLSERSKEVLTRFQVEHVDETTARAFAWGVATEDLKTAVKAATLHGVSVENVSGEWRASVVLDV